MYVYISEDSKGISNFSNAKLVWEQGGLAYGDWYGGPNADGVFVQSTEVPISKVVFIFSLIQEGCGFIQLLINLFFILCIFYNRKFNTSVNFLLFRQFMLFYLYFIFLSFSNSVNFVNTYFKLSIIFFSGCTCLMVSASPVTWNPVILFMYLNRCNADSAVVAFNIIIINGLMYFEQGWLLFTSIKIKNQSQW